MFFVDEQQKAQFSMPFAFPISLHRTFLRDKPQGFTNWHYHEELQITYVVEGEITVTLQGASYTVKAGEAIFINANLSHMTTSNDPQTAQYVTLNFLSSMLTLFHGSVIEQKYYLPFRNDPLMQVATFSPDIAEEKQFILGLRALLTDIEKQEFGYELIAYSILLGLWKFLLDHTNDGSRRIQPTENEEARKLLVYLQEHYAERITLDELADQVHISKGACCRLFRASYGCSPFSYLIDYRLQQSIVLLADASLPVSQIAERCGFNSTSYFIKTFREKIGSTPLQYRLATK